MSLKATSFMSIPEETVRVARAAYPKGNRYLRLRDTFGPLFENEGFEGLFSREGRPAEEPARLAVITILQFAENLSDEQAVEQVRGRIDWKYLLGLPLEYSGFDASVLSEFRTRLIEGQAEHLLFETLLRHFREQGLLRSRGRQRSDSTHVLAKVRTLNRLECVGTSMRHALNTLSMVVPEWLLSVSQPAWLERYGPRFEEGRLPESKAARLELATVIGADGLALLHALDAPEVPEWLRTIPALKSLRRVWIENYTWTEAGTLRWRTQEEMPPAGQRISSPYDLDAHYSEKRTTQWVGYKVFLTESCDADQPHLITNVATTSAPTTDEAVTPTIHAALERRDLLPALHLVDTGFIEAELICDSQTQYELDLCGPVRGDYRRQAREGLGFAAEHFSIDWEAQQATCPAGRTSSSWSPAVDRGHHKVIKIKFSERDCRACPHRAPCTDGRYRTITLRPKEQYLALQSARRRQLTPEFRRTYAARAGIEGTISQGTRSCDLRRTRYIGLPKTHLQHLAIASAINLRRVADWLDDAPRARTRHSSFERLYRLAA